VSVDPYATQFDVHDVHRDITGGFRKALEHLASLGHERIAYVGTRKDRYARFVAATIETKLPVDMELTCWLDVPPRAIDYAVWRESAAKHFSQWVADRRDFTAVICQNDYIAFGVMDAARQAKLKIGKDLSIVGFDNIERNNPGYPFEPGLTTVDSAYDEIGRRCAISLVEQIRGGRRQIIHERVPIDLVVRDTTGPASK
jgi:LacI family transcriptional regulator